MLALFPTLRARVAAAGWAVAAGAGLAFYVAHVSFGAGGRPLDHFASTWVYDGLEVLAFAGVLARAIFIRPERPAWVLLAAAVASWTLGDVLWSAAYGGSPPFPSWCDVFYLGFYPPALVGLALLVRFRLSRFNSSVWLDGLMVALMVASVGAAVLLDVILHQTQGKLLSDATNLAYPLGDIVLLALLAGVFGLARWRPGRDWSLIAAALAVTAVGDGVYLYESAVGSYVPGTILDAFWPAALLLLTASAWLVPRRRPRVLLQDRPLAATPLLCGTVAVAVLVDSYLQRRNAVGVALAAATVFTVIGRTVMTFRENARVTASTTTLALTDPLTGLWNRRKLLADLDEALETGLEAGAPPRLLLLYDLNGFKGYNDSFGHPAGDLLLSRLAQKLAVSVGSTGTSYRLGGDEFCVLAAVDPQETEAFLDATTTALSESGEGFNVTTAFGCVFLPDEAAVPSEALHLADQRLYAQKYQSLVRNGQPHRALVQALYEREPGLVAHIGEVTELSLLIARELQFSRPALEEIELAAQLHDIGKLAIPDSTLSKPGPLDEQEQALIREHTAIGQRILSASPAFSKVALIVRSTHERWDGTGYPDGLEADQIPLPARIIAVADAFSAMTGERPYREQLSGREALREIERCAGAHFDPAVVSAFARSIDAYRVASPPLRTPSR